MSGSLGERAKQAVLWSTGFGLFRDGLQFAVMLIMVRLLEPAAYGQFALAGSIIGFVALLSFDSFVEHTLQARRDADVDYQLHFTAGGLFQITAFLVANGIALVAREIPTYAEAAPLVHAMSFLFLLKWPHEIRARMLERALDWRRLRLLQAAGLLAVALTSILMALAGAGAYALAVPGLLMTLPFIYDLFVRTGFRPDWRFDRRRYRPALQFGLAQLPNGLTTRLRPLLEQGLIVSMLGYASVGFLTRATGLATLVCQGPAHQLVTAIYPVMTKIEPGTAQYRRMSTLVIRTVVWSSIPVAALFTVLVEPVVGLIYGAQWTSVVPLLPWTMLAAALGALQHTLLRLLLAHDQVRVCFIANLVWLAGIAACLVLLLQPLGLVAYLAGLCAIQAALALGLAAVLQRVGGLNAPDLWHALGAALSAIALALVVVWPGFALLGLDKDTTLGAVLFGGLVALLYLGALRTLFPRQLNELLAYLPGGRAPLRRGLATPPPDRAG